MGERGRNWGDLGVGCAAARVGVLVGIPGDPVLDPGLKMGYFVGEILKMAQNVLIFWCGRGGVFWRSRPSSSAWP